MITVNLNDPLSEAVELIATQQHQPVGKLIEQVLTDFLEDYRDARIAEQAIKEIDSGEAKVLSLTDARRLYDQLAG